MGRVRVIVGAYREWAKLLANRSFEHLEDRSVYIAFTAESLLESFAKYKPEIVLLIGWSWMCPREIYEAVPTLCLHPSRLPQYRGGSPLQHQIINGEKESAVTIFRVTGEVDAGDVYAQCPISLGGSLADIFDRVIQVGAPMVRVLVDAFLRGEDLHRVPQHRLDTIPYDVLDRRQPYQSDLLEWINEGPRTSEEISNFIRALDHPDYPRAFIRGSDGEKVELGWVR